MNTELFKKIEKHIVREDGSFDPRTFHMSSWEDDDACGTTRCISGWAIFETTGQPLFDPDQERHQSVAKLADRLGVEPEFEAIGAELLGLPADMIGFFYVSEEVAVEFVKRAARGDSVESIREWRDSL